MSYKLSFERTNNMAKYEALILGLKEAIEIGISRIHIYGDSQLIIKQVNEVYKTKDEKLIPYRDYVIKLLTHFKGYQLESIPRSSNRLADAMASAASLIPLEIEDRETSFTIRNLETSSTMEESAICVVQRVGYEENP